MQITSTRSPLEDARSLVSEAQKKIMDSVDAAKASDPVTAVTDAMLAKETVKVARVLANTEDQMMKSTVDMVA